METASGDGTVSPGDTQEIQMDPIRSATSPDGTPKGQEIRDNTILESEVSAISLNDNRGEEAPPRQDTDTLGTGHPENEDNQERWLMMQSQAYRAVPSDMDAWGDQTPEDQRSDSSQRSATDSQYFEGHQKALLVPPVNDDVLPDGDDEDLSRKDVYTPHLPTIQDDQKPAIYHDPSPSPSPPPSTAPPTYSSLEKPQSEEKLALVHGPKTQVVVPLIPPNRVVPSSEEVVRQSELRQRLAHGSQEAHGRQQNHYYKKDDIVIGAEDNTDGAGCCGWILMMFSVLLIIITLPFSLVLCIKVVQEYERAVIFRLGRLPSGGAKGPGIFFIIPCIESYTKVDLRTVSFDVPPQEVLTKDSVTVSVDAVVYYRVFNPTVSVANVENAHHSTRLLAQTTLRNILGTKNMSEILSDRESISQGMQSSLDEATDRWGIKVERVEIKDVRLPVQLQRAMAAEAEAAREARAKVIAAEGEHKASRALKDAADVMATSGAALQLRYLQTLNSISAEKNSTIIFPLPVDMLQHFMKKF